MRIVGRFTGAPHCPVAERLCGQHNVLRGRAGRNNLLRYGDLLARFDARGNHEDYRRAERLLLFAGEHFRRCAGLASLERLGEEQTERRAALAGDHDEVPGPQTAVIRRAQRALQHRVDLFLRRARFLQLYGGGTLEEEFHCIHADLRCRRPIGFLPW